MSSEVVRMTVLIKFVDDPDCFIDLSNFFGAFKSGHLYLEIIFYYEAAIIGKFDEFLI